MREFIWSVMLASAALPALAGDGAFETIVEAAGFDRPVAVSVAPDGRLFVAEQRGVVWVIEDGVRLEPPFIDLQDEINGSFERGLLGIEVDPDFLTNGWVYLLYVVDPEFGEPDESAFFGTFGRLTRFQGSAATNGAVADLATRQVLIGVQPHEGIPVCYASHSVGDLEFGPDGSLFVSTGDGANYGFVDDGGSDPECFVEGMFPPEQDIGSFRAQMLDSKSGKVLRIDPATGLGLPDNPYWTGEGAATASMVWTYGCRNPFRIAVRPTPPLLVAVSDVGNGQWEEVSFSQGGENLGWPCREGPIVSGGHEMADPAAFGCETLETPINPGPLTPPVAWWHHYDPQAPGSINALGSVASAVVFYDGGSFPSEYDGVLFFSDFIGFWIRSVDPGPDPPPGEPLSGTNFFANIGWVVDLDVDPTTGDLILPLLFDGEIRRITWDDAKNPIGDPDLNGDGFVDAADLAQLLGAWGDCRECPADLDFDGVVSSSDLAVLLAAWS